MRQVDGDRSLQIAGVARRYRARRGASPVAAIDGVDLSVPHGSIAAILGASGSGKTTLLRLVAGFEPIDAGFIRLDGQMLSQPGHTLAPEQRGIGMVFQQTALLPHLTLEANVAFGLHAIEPNARQQRVMELLAMTGLEAEAKRFPHQVSGGQAQRASLARALAPRPVLMLLDEPVNNLDSALKLTLLAELRELLRQTDTSALFVTHDHDEAFAVADQLVVLHAGKVAQAGPPAEVYHRPDDEHVARYLGATNILPIQTTATGSRFEPPFDRLGSLDGRRVIGSVAGPVASVRPEQLRIEPHRTIGAESHGLEAKVVEARFMGERWAVTVAVAGRRLVAHGEPTMVVAAGDLIRLTLRA